MDSIDDILNAEDSDDEVLADNVDLEFLLHSKDEFDEAEDDSQDLHIKKIHSNKPIKVDDHNSTHSVQDAAEDGSKANTGTVGTGITSVTVVEPTAHIIEVEDIDENTEDSHLTFLYQAEQREQKFLQCGQKIVVSALQSKRTGDALLNYSNVRCDELLLLSSQLKRNSSYKQHGPGAATSVMTNYDYIAIGTSKGLIILFGYDQEIRCILGSSIPTESRPSSAVTSLDAVKVLGGQLPQQPSNTAAAAPLEGLLVCGYATGELALWDIAKGTILRLVTELHSSAIVTSSVLDSTSDGLANIGCGPPGSGEENLVALSSVWFRHVNANPLGTAVPSTAGTLSSFRLGLSSSIASVANSSSMNMQSVSIVVVSVDRQGVTYKTRFAKTMWSSAYSSESECLLDASTGPLSGYAPLPPLLRSLQSNSPSFYRNLTNIPGSKACCRYVAAHRTARLLAINVGKAQTWIVQTHPKIRILFKWEAPSETKCQGDGAASVGSPSQEQLGVNAASATGATTTTTSSRCLDWSWIALRQDAESRATADQEQQQEPCPIILPNMEEHGHQQVQRQKGEEEGVDWVPALARSWGEWVEVLCIVTTSTSSSTTSTTNTSVASAASALPSTPAAFASASASAAEKARSSTSSYQTKFFVAHRACFVGQKILSVRWVSSTELVLFTTSDVIATNQKLEVTEKFPLQPSLSITLNATFSSSSNVAPVLTIGSGGESGVTALHESVCGRQLFLLVEDALVSVQMQSCFDLADRLTTKGQWLEALALVLENVRRSPSLLQLFRTEVDQYIVRYAELAVKHSGPNASAVATSTIIHNINNSGSSSIPSASATNAVVSAAQNKNHFHLVAGVCIEYCISCERLDLLFSHVYIIFKSVQRHYIFLEALEPFILSRDISSLPPALIAEFCESALRLNRLPSIERCVPYFDIAHLDINFITKFLYENRMHSSFLYVYAHGLNDFPEAFQIIFNFMLAAYHSGDAGGRSGISGKNDLAHPEEEGGGADHADVGYKLLLFLCYSFDGKVFPRGCPMQLQQLQRQEDICWQLLQLVTCSQLRPTPSIFTLQSSVELQAAAASLGAYPYLGKLCELDAPALFHALHKGVTFVQSQIHFRLAGDSPPVQPVACSSSAFTPPASMISGLSSVYENVLNFCILADEDFLVKDASSEVGPPLGRTERTFFEVFTELIIHCRSCLRLSFLERFINFCCTFSSSASGCAEGQERAKYERKLVVLATSQPKENAAHSSALATVLADRNFGLASLHAVSMRSAVSAEQFRRCLSFYVKQSTDCPEMKVIAYQYVDEAMHRAAACEHGREEECGSALRSEVLKMLVPLCYLDLPQTRRLVENYLSTHVSEIMENSTQDLKMQFALLSALIPGPGVLPGDRGRALKVSFSEPAVLAYFNLLATYDPTKTMEFLKSFESHYPMDACLQICQQKGISEAVALLMEKKGDVLDALLLLLRDFSTKLKQVRRDVDAQLRSEMATQAAAAKAKLRVGGAGGLDSDRYVVLTILGKEDVERAEAAKKLPAFRMLESLINCVADLCSRNSLQADRANGMWLTAFDHLLMERQIVRSGTASSSGEVVLVLIGLMLQTLMAHTSTNSSSNNNISNSNNNNSNYNTTITGSSSSSSTSASAITPQEIIRRVTAQGNAAGIRLGEFKSMMLNMLSSNEHELFLHSLTNEVIRADLAALHRQKIAILKRYVHRSDGSDHDDDEEEEEMVLAAGEGEGEGEARRGSSRGDDRRNVAKSHRRRYNHPPPLRKLERDPLVSSETAANSHPLPPPRPFSTAAAFIEACRSRPPAQKSCDYQQLHADAQVSPGSSLRLVLSTAPPPPSFASASSSSDGRQERQPGRLEREPLYLASL